MSSPSERSPLSALSGHGTAKESPSRHWKVMVTEPVLRRLRKGPMKVSVIGSGNWGTAVSRLVATNCAESYVFDNEVSMWVHPMEMHEGKSLASWINENHENPKYLKGFSIPENVKAVTSLEAATRDMDLLIFVLPHQFVVSVCEQMKPYVQPGTKAISLIKGLYVSNHGIPEVFSDMISKTLEIECSALSGANVALDVARADFAEATIGFLDTDHAAVWQQLFARPYFRVTAIPDVRGVQVCGAVKNLIAITAGFCDGMGRGTNTKAAAIRLGIEEMKLFAILFFDNIKDETFFDSAGIADVITTCFGGRNVRCAAEFIRKGGWRGETSWEKIESEMLQGQKLQGNLTCKEVYHCLDTFGLLGFFPLFAATYKIAWEGMDPANMLAHFQTDVPPSPRIHCTNANVPKQMAVLKAEISAMLTEAKEQSLLRNDE